ncbi:MAG TPA: lipoyl synthase [Candidatus Omnitrophota bacterium]|nr:lipoyl synthase [Candidatus Omnitrophota bacterium]
MRPVWLNKKINLKSCGAIKSMLRELRLGTVCEEALCPNIGECFSKGNATFLILGNNCTRLCSFCAVRRGVPEPVDPDEPLRIARGVMKLALAHVVITSVTRDDLPDGGAGHFVETVKAIRRLNPVIARPNEVRTKQSDRLLRRPEIGSSPLVMTNSANEITVELLIPDFNFDKAALRAVIDSGPDIIAHNIETVPRLYKEARQGADYKRSLAVLRYIKEHSPSIPVKSGIMLGLGESEGEVLATLEDIVNTGCGFLSIGQYLAPSREHFPVKEYLRPERFTYYKDKALSLGFKHVESGSYVRSSYHASDYIS